MIATRNRSRTMALRLMLLACCIASCGGATGTFDRYGESENETETETDPADEVVNTEKLIGTPFEGLTTGDDFPNYYFICDQYRTETIDAFPIPIFTAFFTEAQEMEVAEGVAIANEAMGFEAYTLTETWAEDVRIIYRVNEIYVAPEAIGITYPVDQSFDGFVFSREQASDWAIAIKDYEISDLKWTVAHELGHASGIRFHGLIDYENDNVVVVDLNWDDLMQTSLPVIPSLDHYTYMMERQGQIMQEHLGIQGSEDISCEALKQFYEEEQNETE